MCEKRMYETYNKSQFLYKYWILILFWLSLVVSLSSSSQSFDGFCKFLAHVQDLCFLFLNVIV